MKFKYLYVLAFAFILAACNNAGNEGESTTKEETTSNEEMESNDSEKAAVDGEYKLMASESVVNWKGEKVTGEHTGTVQMESGMVTIKNGEIASGEIVMDMSTISNEDLKDDPDSQAKLEGHLKSDDFFSVDKHKTASFKIEGSEKVDGVTMVNGILTIKGMSEPAVLKLEKSMMEDGKMTASGTMTVDRTKYDIKFRSGKFFEDLGDKLIYDDFMLDFKVIAQK
ncbi:YceI family protein [Halocola ammonii]